MQLILSHRGNFPLIRGNCVKTYHGSPWDAIGLKQTTTYYNKAITICFYRVFNTRLDYFGSGSGGSGEIRTHEGRKPLAVFKTAAFNHSATLPDINFIDYSAIGSFGFG